MRDFTRILNALEQATRTRPNGCCRWSTDCRHFFAAAA